MRYSFILSLIVIFFFGCQGGAFKNDVQQNNYTTEQMSQEQNPSDDNGRLTRFEGYEISKRRRENFQNQQPSHIQDEFTTERTIDISNHLMNLDEVNQAQVVETDEKVIVGVIINLHADREIANKIEKEVKPFTEEGQDIIVYTDDTYWYDRIDEDASGWAAQLGEDVESIFDNFFNIAD